MRLYGSGEVDLGPLPKSDHPNGQPFRGILCRLDEPSDSPPGGSKGHRVLVPSKVAGRRLDTLVGMGVNFQTNGMDGHDEGRKVGVITGAWIDGNRLMVDGLLYALNFPDEIESIRENKDNLGMSYEIDDVIVENKNTPVWKALDLKFTGAAILLKNAAAYRTTAIAASRASEGTAAGILTRISLAKTAMTLTPLTRSKRNDPR